jgi:AcrR family transcriptional regulator
MSDTRVHTPVARGPAEHSVRDQIVEAANECFARYGYGKTTVADLAREIGEAICSSRLDQIIDQAKLAIEAGDSATDRFRRMFKALTTLSVELFFDDRKIYNIAAHAASEQWGSARAYRQTLMTMLTALVREGREAGEFERKTPIDETCRAIYYAMMPFVDPLHLERNLDLLPDGQNEVASLILRSLAP